MNNTQVKPIPDHPYHALTHGALHYIIRDAGEAARNMRGLNYAAECKYLDQVNDACTVLRYRQQCARTAHANWRNTNSQSENV